MNLFLHLAALSLTWAQLDINALTQLNSNVQIPAAATHAALLLPRGMKFKILGFQPLDEIRVQTIQAQGFPCSSQMDQLNLPVEMVDADYGVEVHPHCMISVYLEFKDLNRPSFFSRISESARTP
jgi:hypothetical protein